MLRVANAAKDKTSHLRAEATRRKVAEVSLATAWGQQQIQSDVNVFTVAMPWPGEFFQYQALRIRSPWHQNNHINLQSQKGAE